MKSVLLLKWIIGAVLIGGLVYFFRKKNQSVSVKEKDSPGIKEVFNKIFNPETVNGTTVKTASVVKPPQVNSLTAQGMPEPFRIPGFLEPAKIITSKREMLSYDPPLQVKTLPNPIFETAKYITPGKSTPIEVPKVVYAGRTIESRTVQATVVNVGSGGKGIVRLDRSSK
jgi:hypothetical protein